MKLRLIGDLHGNHNAIIQILQSCHHYDLTIQLGDFGVGFGAEAYLPLIDSSKFRLLHGNHDNPDLIVQFPHDLGRFGIFELAGKRIFFVAGAWSIDYDDRTPGLSWWDNEQLSFQEAELCLQLWEKECKTIDLVLSHDGPPNATMHIKNEFPYETHTGRLLWEMWKIHNPPLWRFGHWHRSWNKKIGKTNFKCLTINEQEIIETSMALE